MVKKTKIKSKKNEKTLSYKNKDSININGMINKTKRKIILKNIKNISKLNNTVSFQINPNSKKEFEKEYYKRYLYYIKEEFNSTILTMLYNFLLISGVIPDSYKDNRYFINEFIEIIINLLINEMELVIASLILDSMGWVQEGAEPWKYIYYICLYAKNRASDKFCFTILANILEENNPGFIDSYNKWININFNSNKKKEEQFKIMKINERYKELMKPLINDNKSHINYNELVNKIFLYSKKRHGEIIVQEQENKKNFDEENKKINYINDNNDNNDIYNLRLSQLKGNLHHDPLNLSNNPSGFFTPGRQSNFDIPFNYLGLSRNASNKSLNSLEGDIYKVSSMRFNNNQ